MSREVNIMTKLASIHFGKCRPGAAPERHNARQYSNDDFRPGYFLPEADQEPNTVRDLLEPENADAAKAADNAKAYFDQVKSHYTGRGKRAKYDNCRREAILNLNETSTEDDVRGVVKYLEERWHLKTTSYAIHRDEGYKDKDGTVHRNLHAHLVLETLYVDQATGKPKQAWSAIGRKELHQIQDDIAKLMHMERTQTQGKPRKHLTRDSYVQIKTAQDRAAQATKAAALETEKARTATAQATEAAKQAAQETQQAKAAQAAAAKQAEETARQAAQVRHDIEVHRLQPSGILVNRALREANTQQAAIIDKLNQQAKWTAAKHKSDLADKDRQITEAREETDAKRQTISQLRQQIQEQQQTIQQQQDEITATRAAAKMFARMQNYYQCKIVPDEERQQDQANLFEIIKDTVTTMTDTVMSIFKRITTAINEEINPEVRAARLEKERLEREQAAREAAERRQAEEAKKSQSRGYVR